MPAESESDGPILTADETRHLSHRVQHLLLRLVATLDQRDAADPFRAVKRILMEQLPWVSPRQTEICAAHCRTRS